jgi:hypothetical protein
MLPELHHRANDRFGAGTRPVARCLSLLVLMATTLVVAACEDRAPVAPPPPTADFQPTATVEDLMRMMIDPAADAMWDAVVVTSTLDGLEEQRPETDDEWLALERDAILLLEAGNLLQIEHRPVAAPDSVSQLPGVDLEPADIAARIVASPDAWQRSARELHDVGVVMLEAVRARNLEALLAGGDRLDATCENCHSRFWYPSDP